MPVTARDIMTADPATCVPETPLEQVAQLMVLQDCGEIPVVEALDSPRVVGVITDRDIVCRFVAKGKNPLDHTAAECMSQPAVTVSASATLNDVASAMRKHQIRRVLVVDGAERCLGIVSQADVAWHGAEHDVAKVVRDVSRDTDSPSH